MAKSIPYVGILLFVLFVVDGQSATSEESHCSYTFNVKTGDCSQTPGEDQLLKSSVMALQAQVRLQTEQPYREHKTGCEAERINRRERETAAENCDH